MNGGWACFFGHLYDTPTVTFTEPSGQAIEGRGPAVYRLAQYSMLGCSTLTAHCKRCGAVRVTYVAGDARRST